MSFDVNIFASGRAQALFSCRAATGINKLALDLVQTTVSGPCITQT